MHVSVLAAVIGSVCLTARMLNMVCCDHTDSGHFTIRDVVYDGSPVKQHRANSAAESQVLYMCAV